MVTDNNGIPRMTMRIPGLEQEVQRVAEIVVAKATRQRNKIKAKAIPIVIHQTQKGSLFSVKAKTTVKAKHRVAMARGQGKAATPTRTHRRPVQVAIKVTTSTPAQGNNIEHPTVQGQAIVGRKTISAAVWFLVVNQVVEIVMLASKSLFKKRLHSKEAVVQS